MDERERIIEEWRGSVKVAMGALTAFDLALEDWAERDADDEEFMAEIRCLCNVGLDDWLDGHPLDVDFLHDLVTGEELPEPMTDDALIIFGEGQ